MLWLAPPVLSGILLGLAFPPADLWWVVLFGMTPLLWHLHRQPSGLHAFLSGFIAGTIFCLLVLRPLVSAYLWSGWEEGMHLTMEAAEARQQQVLIVLWLLLGVWGGVFWGVFAGLAAWLTRSSLVRMALCVPPLFLLVAEWLRSLFSWDYHWAFLGNTLVEVEALRQLVAVGGIWLLSWLAVLVNVGALGLLLALRQRKPHQLAVLASIAGVVVVAMFVGIVQQRHTEAQLQDRPGISVAALQFHKPEYHLSDYIEIGLERDYVNLLYHVITRHAGDIDLLVLPESVAVTAVSLDGTTAEGTPDDEQFSLQEWTEVVLRLMDQSDAQISMVMGLKSIEGGNTYNSMLYWNALGLSGTYHKQRLVPFAEHSPAKLDLLGLRGRSAFAPGNNSQPVMLNNIHFGNFICQEVLVPEITREAVLSGAEILVSGGNDGVFADPAVARIHARLARLRAVETGRYTVRAMKTGVSAIISPTGQELARSPDSAPHLVRGMTYPLDHHTLYVRFGNWPLVPAVLMVTLSATIARRRRHTNPPGQAPRDT